MRDNKSPWSSRKQKTDKTQKLRQYDGKTGDYVCWLIFADIMATGARYEITQVELHKLMTKLKKNLIFKICPKSTLSLLASRYDMPTMPCFPIGGMKKQHDAILESFGTTEEII